MLCETVQTVIRAPREQTFAYLADVRNLPRWATEFCLGLERVDGRYHVTTPQGRVLFDIEADAATGVVDFVAGPEPDALTRWPARVVGLPSGDSAVLFTCVHEPHVPEQAFRGQVESLRREMQNVRRTLEQEQE